MKKIVIAIVAIFALNAVNAQTFKKFRVDLSTGYAIPGGSGAKGGVLVACEPKYALNDHIAVGLRMEAAIMARGTQYVNRSGVTTDGDAEVKGAGSYLLTGDYYFNTNKFRPFVGVGIGTYSIAGTSVSFGNNHNAGVDAGNKFGGMLRTGFDYGHFRMGLEYNLVGKTPGVSYSDGSKISDSKNGYFSIKVGFFLGGGRK